MSAHELISKIKENICRVIVGKEDVIEFLLVGLLSDGHILIEDVPGSGKTVLAKAFATSLGVSFKRVQFTPDLLPADITGVKYYNMKNSEFEFIPGPVFANIILADEINRGTPKTQSGLLECMEEHTVTVDGETFDLPSPFMVIATQNPIESMGVFPLPEAQLDRFLLKLKMGYPTREENIRILSRFEKEDPLSALTPVTDGHSITKAREEVKSVFVHPDLLGYISEIVEFTRYKQGVVMGASTRSCIALLKASKAMALINGRDYVIPDDIKKVAVPVIAHRLVLKTSLSTVKDAAEDAVREILALVNVPTEDFDKYKL